MLTLDEFLRKVEEEFDEIEKGSLHAETDIRSTLNWNSLHALQLMGLITIEFDIDIVAEDIIQSRTFGDLYDRLVVLATG